MLRYVKNMKHCFYRLTAAAIMRIVQVMEAEHRSQQGFQALARLFHALRRMAIDL